MWKKSQKFPEIFPKNVTILKDYWTQLAGGHYTVDVDKNELRTFRCPKDFIRHCRGKKPIQGTSWEAVELLFVPLNFINTHWVTMVIENASWYIYIFDSNLSATNLEKMKGIVEPFVHLVPKILKQSGMFDHLLKVSEEVPLQYSWAHEGVLKQVTS